MELEISFFSHGKEDRPNEDTYGFDNLRPDLFVAVIADGVGGNKGGAEASALAVKVFMDEMRNNPDAPFADIFIKITNSFVDAIEKDISLGEMASTLSCIRIERGVVQFSHVGDSRIYHLRKNGIIQKTPDQTEAALLLDQGILSPSRARKYYRRTVLTSALSSKGDYTLITGEFELASGDRVLLLTDGVYRIISKKELRDTSMEQPIASDFSTTIEQTIRERGLVDDATMICIELMN